MRFRGGGIGHVYMRQVEPWLDATGWGTQWPFLGDRDPTHSEPVPPTHRSQTNEEGGDSESEDSEDDAGGASGNGGDGEGEDEDGMDPEQPEDDEEDLDEDGDNGPAISGHIHQGQNEEEDGDNMGDEADGFLGNTGL